MKYIMMSICAVVSIISLTGCSSNKSSVPPIYYDYGYTFDEKVHSIQYHNYIPTYRLRSNEHKHEFIKFDYRTN